MGGFLAVGEGLVGGGQSRDTGIPQSPTRENPGLATHLCSKQHSNTVNCQLKWLINTLINRVVVPYGKYLF